MQRDAYSALVKKAHKLKIPVSILQVNGRVTRENLYDECFDGYAARRLVLMTNMECIPAQHPHEARPSHDVMIPDFATFCALHRPYYQYQLVPLMCRDVETFAALQAACASPGSLFWLATDRREPKMLRYRFSQGSTHRQLIADFFKPHISAAEWSVPVASRRLPIQEVQFDGVLFRAARRIQTAHDVSQTTSAVSQSSLVTAALYVTTHTTLSAAIIQQRALMRDFYHSSVYNIVGPNSDVHREIKGASQAWHVLAVSQPMDPVLSLNFANMAAEKNLVVYVKSAPGSYRYVQPSTLSSH